MKFSIREERIQERTQTERLVELAFAPVAESDHKEHLLVRRLRETAAFIPELSIVAEEESLGIIGHILLTRAKIISCEGAPAAETLALAPLSVLPRFQRRGIGGALINYAHSRAAELGFGSAVVLGHKEYYPRFGYRPAFSFGIAFPFEAPAECCMAVELVPGALTGVRGTLRYAPEFSRANDN